MRGMVKSENLDKILKVIRYQDFPLNWHCKILVKTRIFEDKDQLPMIKTELRRGLRGAFRSQTKENLPPRQLHYFAWRSADLLISPLLPTSFVTGSIFWSIVFLPLACSNRSRGFGRERLSQNACRKLCPTLGIPCSFWKTSTLLLPRFHPMVDSPNSQSAFIASVISFLRNHDFDGLDVDWIYPDLKDKIHFTALIHVS